MNIFLTGATGYIGNNLAHNLASNGDTVHALVRKGAKVQHLNNRNIKVYYGDILNPASIEPAMTGCTHVYHTAAAVAPWIKKKEDYYNVNVTGTQHVMEAAANLGIARVVFTSTCGVLGPSLLQPLREEDPRITGYKTDYELSKKLAEDVVKQYTKQGMHAVIVCPAKVFGPGPRSHGLTANAVIDRFLKSGILVIPSPGNYKACFCFMDDIVSGHVLAMEHGTSGERYILGGHNLSYYDFFAMIRHLSRCKGSIVKMPGGLFKSWAIAQNLRYKIFGTIPSFTSDAVDLLLANYIFSSDKAVNQLGYAITPLEDAIHTTIQFLKSKRHE